MTTTDTKAPTGASDPDEGGGPPPRPPYRYRAFTGLVHHGGQVVPDADFQAAGGRVDVTPVSAALPGDDAPATTDFVYLFPGAERLPEDNPVAVVTALRALGSAMIEDSDTNTEDSDIPAIYTYFGQFIDHDLTLNTNTNFPGIDITEPVPAAPDFVTGTLENLREPALNLDSVYGIGPTDPVVPYIGGLRLDLGPCVDAGAGRPLDKIPGVPCGPGSAVGEPDRRDLPRVNKKARIGDPRNDENLIVAQLHVAFLLAHNAIVDRLQDAGQPQNTLLSEAQRILRWTYQWLVRNDFLVKLVDTESISAVSDPKFFTQDRLCMPLEFATAAFRFGHSMVRGSYDWNRNFGRADGDPNDETRSPFDLLFAFTGGGKLGLDVTGFDADQLPDNWPAEWDRLVGGDGAPKDQMARRIDTNLALPLDSMSNEGNDQPDAIKDMLKRLAVRNLLRGYKLAMPTGQAVAAAYEVEVLTPDEILAGPPAPGRLVRHALLDGDFLESTPLWFYILREAEVRRGGNGLGPVGGRIVAETLIGELKKDPASYLSVDEDWSPAQEPIFSGANPFQITEIADLLRLAGVLAPR
ncbi:heme peroxidase family protein [Actinomycetospora sp. OC33-EN08]|uniref:Heme peroxidase family protein n=1 Tax=Actinomycetospora aurantiaca TaxID=3129233 RepID=A0ABU8ML63_9PSEU